MPYGSVGRLISLAGAGYLVFLLGCSENSLIGTPAANRRPEVWLSSGPVEGDTTGYQIHFYWGGWDPDGEVKRFEFIIVDGNPFGFNQEDTTGLRKWHRTACYDSVFRVSAGDNPQSVTIGGSKYTKYDMTHTFFIRAVDGEGMRSWPAYRSFTAWTLAPYVVIDRPPMPANLDISTLSRVVTFHWTGKDPIDSPDNTQDPDSIRYLCMAYDRTFNIVNDINAHPLNYESKWRPHGHWISYHAAEDSGRSVTISDLELNKNYLFAVQAKDEAGAVTGIFDRRSNARLFIASLQAGPLLSVSETFLGGFRFLGVNMTPETRDLPPGVALNFKWYADASSYGGEVVCYQWGWDVADVKNPSDWQSDCSPYNLACTGIWYSGVHTLFVRAVDNAGTETLGLIEITVVPFLMDRNLLWVDDFPSQDFQQVSYAMPTETEHDEFWLGICSRAAGFEKDRDVYDALNDYNAAPPRISLISRYRNIIWTYSSAPLYGAWDNVIQFTPESFVGQGTTVAVNYLAIFMSKGGHLLTEGRSDAVGGLAALLMPAAQSFPMNLRCEITGNTTGCSGDTSGVNSMAYRDYCVTVLDKVFGVFRTDVDMPQRLESADAMVYGYRDDSDPVTAANPGLPDSLTLWDEVVKPGRFFYPRDRGFTYVEVYDPAYWMDLRKIQSQSCFHPMYRMRARNSYSPLDGAPVALWLTKYANVDPDDAGPGVAAPSFHFGLELWFFNRAQVNALFDMIFDTWGIRASQATPGT